YQHRGLAGAELTRSVNPQVEVAARHSDGRDAPLRRVQALQRHRRAAGGRRQQQYRQGNPGYLSRAHGFSATKVGSFKATFSPAVSPEVMANCSSLRGPTATGRCTNFE